MGQRRISAEIVDVGVKNCLAALATDASLGLKADRAQLLASGGLVIHGALSPLAKTANTIYATPLNAAGTPVLVKQAAADMAALSGTVTNTKFNVFCFFIDSGGTLSTVMGTEGATLAAVQFPAFDGSKVCIGFVIINPTGTGNFVGGTTNLDDATVVPNAAYVNTTGSFNPSANPTIVP